MRRAIPLVSRAFRAVAAGADVMLIDRGRAERVTAAVAPTFPPELIDLVFAVMARAPTPCFRCASGGRTACAWRS